MTDRQLHGLATLRINGQVYESQDATLTPGGIKNHPRMVGKKFFFNQSFEPSTCVVKIAKIKGLSLKYLQSLSGAEIQFESDAGETYIMRNAAQVGDITMTGGADGGLVELTFNGEEIEEMVR
ncbi:phage tail tube protein [Micavibrio aeruginosavorus]|uniref:phage tail tube protein n=1 Tax=Micavibrio aeruginosavorus TaxID=349221 RepID=UPI003F4AB532